MLLSIGLIGNVLVLMWRLSQKRDQRTSPLSILILTLAGSDFLYCVHLLLLKSLMADSKQGQDILEQISSRCVCTVSGALSLLSCCTAQWTIFIIAIYSLQTMNKWCSRCCCSLIKKRNVLIAITCQMLVVGSGISLLIYVFLYHFPRVDIGSYQHLRNNMFSNFSRREQITEIFGRCAWAQTNGFAYCYNNTRRQSYTIYKGIECTGHVDTLLTLGIILASHNSILAFASVVLYLLLCIRLRRAASQVNLTERSDIHKLQWRLSVIILLNALCWIPVTAVIWTTTIVNNSDSWKNDSTAASVLVISISPAVNPLIYTFIARNFLHSIRKYWRRIECEIYLRRNSANYDDDDITGVERCSCIPCMRCVHRYEDYWITEETSVWSSATEQCRLLTPTIDPGKAT